MGLRLIKMSLAAAHGSSPASSSEANQSGAMTADATTASRPHPAPVFYGNLESIRGLAALSVVFVHCLGVFRSTAHAAGLGGIAYSLFVDAFNGRNAVVLFFVLSGFVLCESVRGDIISLRLFLAFIVKRAFRIVPVAYAALAFATLYLFLFAPPPGRALEESAEWFLRGFQRPTLTLLLANFTFLSNQIVVVYWTLYVELMASLLFVPLFWLSGLGGWAAQIGVQIALLLISYRFAGQPGWLHLLWLPVLPAILTYFFCFHLGILVNRLRHQFDDRTMQSGSRGVQAEVIDLAAVTFGVYVLSEITPIAYNGDAVEIVLEAFGSCLLVYGCSSPRSRLLDATLGRIAIRYLGQLSFSIYAIHIVVLKPVFVLIVLWLGVYFATSPLLGPLLALAIVVPISITLAHLMHGLVEVPGIRLGRLLVSRAGLLGDGRRVARDALSRSSASP
jgi:peptidoglycan/LPS O-acetylase OafA/YrhL